MSKISAFSENEIPLLSKAAEVIKEEKNDLYTLFTNRSQDLEAFADIVSRTPSLKKREQYGNSKEDITTMVDKLSSIGPTNQLTLPTRAILGRGFIISKINFYYFILKALSDNDVNKDLIEEINKCCEKLVFLLMSEEAYEIIIENNLTDNKSIVKIAADELSHLWEYRMDRNLDSFSPPLMALWKQRCTVIPVLGTLKGAMEIFMLSSKLSEEWVNFLSEKADTNSIQALEEFIFGLNYEEITFLREFMTACSMSSISRDDAIEILKEEYGFNEKECIFLNGNAKEIYSFFHKRLHDTRVRKFKHGDGPAQTIEELFLIYLLEKKRDNLS
ncbi:MAG: hypothetical protein FWD87_04055 [Spirochaetaceae bacterium]|nr:hypothetical protein [Spirochaetaceae bacterium]